MVHNFTTFIQKVAKCDEKQRTYTKTLPEWLAGVNELVNIANARAH
jgi:hypothetical protein